MFRKFALFCVILALAVMLLGAYARLSDPALSCPGCPFELTREAPSDALDQWVRTTFGLGADWRAVEHRHLAAALGGAVLVLFVSAWRAQRRWAAVLWSSAALALVGLQAAIGLWVGSAPLIYPPGALLHGLVGFITLALLYGVYLSQRPDVATIPGSGFGLRWTARLSLLALLLQIGLGLWTSVNGAGLACPDFPTCMGGYHPAGDYERAFHLSPMPVTPDAAKAIAPTAATQIAIHWAHRVAAAFVFVLLSLLALNVSSNAAAARISKAGVLLSFLLLVQIGLGVAAVKLALPLIVVLAHGLVSALLLLDLLHINYYLRAPKAPEEKAEPAVALEAIPAEVLPPPVIPVEKPVAVRPEPDKLFVRLKSGLGKTRGGLTGFLANLALGKKAIDRDLLEDIEAQLLMADIGVTATGEIIAELTDSLERSQLGDVGVLTGRLREHLYQLLEPCSQPLTIAPDKKPFVILVVGVNGVGKTTTIGKLAKRLQTDGKSVMLAAGDTFRAAAVEQLQAWGERNNVHVVAQHTGADSASVIYDGVQSAQSKGVDVLIADTAGRLHTKSNLMEELAKIKRIMAKLDPTAPHEVLLVLDAGTGQNAINQAKQFNDAVGLTGLVLTKLDGTAKGGVIFALAKQFGIPIRYIGVGEGIDDLQDFDAKNFIEALFAE